MFTYENTIKGDFDGKKVWEFYSDVKKWSKWDLMMNDVELQGDFVNGTHGTMHMKNMPPLPFVLEDVAENGSFTVVSVMGDLKVSMGHFIEKQGADVAVKHTINIEGSNESQIQGMGMGISKQIPDSMAKLVELSK